MKRPQLLALYEERSPLRKSHSMFKSHIEEIRKAHDPSTKYDSCIRRARKQKGRDVAEAVRKTILRPEGYSPSQWRTRKPTLWDVDSLDMKADRRLDPLTEIPLLQMCRLKAVKGELTGSEFDHLAAVLFGDPDISKWIKGQGRAEEMAQPPPETALQAIEFNSKYFAILRV